MQNIAYATSGPGTLYNGIGWFNFADLTGSISTPYTVTLANSIKGGGILEATFTLTGDTDFYSMAPPTWGGAAFGNTAYLGLTSPVCLRVTSGEPYYGQIVVSNISLINKYGQNISNYNFYFTDSETPQEGAPQEFITSGTPWSIFYTLPDSGEGYCTLLGVGTQTITTQGSGNAPILLTVNPTSITQTLSGEGAMSFGMSLTMSELVKVINQRIHPSDQFVLSMVGPNGGTTITTGSSTGVQSQGLQVISGNSGTSVYTFNESMAPGSAYPLSFYNQVIQVSNLTSGGTPLPSTINLGGSLTLNVGDYALVTITNTPVSDTIPLNKSVDRQYATVNDVLTYKVSAPNISPYTLTNVMIYDAIPSSSSFVLNSLTLNGTSIPGSPSSGVNVGTLAPSAISTITFQVLVQSTIPYNNIVSNYATLTYVSPLATRYINSQTMTTTINYATLASTKSINKNYATVGDTLIYTIGLKNSGNTTATNVIFSDTISGNYNFVPGTFMVNGSYTSPSDNPNPPGVSIGKIGPGLISTVNFSVKINGIPSPNPILNSSTAIFTYTIDSTTTPVRTGNNSSNSNTSSLQINTANLSNISKSVNKVFVTCGDTITYTVTVVNTGNVTATNVILKDTIPSGTTLVNNSVFVNGLNVAGANPENGVNIGSISPGLVSTLTFIVKVIC